MDQEEYDELMGVNSVCISKNYLPYPTRLWYRTSNPCYQPLGNVFIPYLNREVSKEELGNVLAVFRKGNVLQYPANRWITKSQTFTRIAKGYGRKKCWASQSDKVTEPNVNKFQRTNPTINSNNPNDEYFFPECVDPVKKDVLFPPYSNINPSSVNFPNITNSLSASTGSLTYPISENINKLIPSTIEGGKLISCTREDACSGDVLLQMKNIACNPTSDSNVPGTIVDLCYPANIPVTTYKRKTYTAASTTWPVNGSFFPAYNTNLPVNQTLLNKLSNIQFTI